MVPLVVLAEEDVGRNRLWSRLEVGDACAAAIVVVEVLPLPEISLVRLRNTLDIFGC